MRDTRDPKSVGPNYYAAARPSPAQPRASRLAHWPPPHRSAEIIRKIVKQPHPPGEESTRAARRGWRLKRDLFSDEES